MFEALQKVQTYVSLAVLKKTRKGSVSVGNCSCMNVCQQRSTHELRLEKETAKKTVQVRRDNERRKINAQCFKNKENKSPVIFVFVEVRSLSTWPCGVKLKTETLSKARSGVYCRNEISKYLTQLLAIIQ